MVIIDRNKFKFISLGIIIIEFVIAVGFYPSLPVKMASHWNIYGGVDGYLNRFWGVSIFPILTMFLFLMFLFLPKADPLKENVDKFVSWYYSFGITIEVFLFYVFFLSIAWNLGIRIHLIKLMSPALAVLFYAMGSLLKKTKRNWFIGIRTPWTLSNGNIWEKTHHLGSILFRLSSIFLLIPVIFPEYLFIIVLLIAASTLVVTFTYSFYLFQKK